MLTFTPPSAAFSMPSDKSMDKFDSDSPTAKCSTFAHCRDDPFASMTRVDFIKPKVKKNFLAPRYRRLHPHHPAHCQATA